MESRLYMSKDAQNLFAGTGRRCINPPPGIAHGGWGAQKHEQAEGIDMDLWVTALALAGSASVSASEPVKPPKIEEEDRQEKEVNTKAGNFSRDAIEEAIGGEGFQLWRLKKTEADA